MAGGKTADEVLQVVTGVLPASLNVAGVKSSAVAQRAARELIAAAEKVEPGREQRRRGQEWPALTILERLKQALGAGLAVVPEPAQRELAIPTPAVRPRLRVIQFAGPDHWLDTPPRAAAGQHAEKSQASEGDAVQRLNHGASQGEVTMTQNTLPLGGAAAGDNTAAPSGGSEGETNARPIPTTADDRPGCEPPETWAQKFMRKAGVTPPPQREQSVAAHPGHSGQSAPAESAAAGGMRRGDGEGLRSEARDPRREVLPEVQSGVFVTFDRETRNGAGLILFLLAVVLVSAFLAACSTSVAQSSTPLSWRGELVGGQVPSCSGKDACERYWCPQHPCVPDGGQ